MCMGASTVNFIWICLKSTVNFFDALMSTFKNLSTSAKLSNTYKTLHEKKSEGFKVELSTEQIAVHGENNCPKRDYFG